MTTADIETVRNRLKDIRLLCEQCSEVRDQDALQRLFGRLADQALRALDGEGGEEWFAWRPKPTSWKISDAQPLADNVIAEGLSERDARRIARLPALERAVKTAVIHWRHGKQVRMDDMDALDAAFAALTTTEADT